MMNPALEQPPATVGRIPNSSPETSVRNPIRSMVDRGNFRAATPQSQEVRYLPSVDVIFYLTSKPQNNESDHSHRRIRDLEAELEKVKGEFNLYQDRAMDEISKVRKERDEWEEESKDKINIFHKDYRELSSEWNEKYIVLEKKQEELGKDHATALKAIEKQKLDINELTIEISRSVKISGTTTRDDDHFKMKFASLEGAVRQWVFQTFHGIPNLKHQDLPQIVQDSLKAAVLGYNPQPDSKVDRREIEAVVFEKLRTHIFCAAFVFPTHEQYRSISEALGGTGNFFHSRIRFQRS